MLFQPLSRLISVTFSASALKPGKANDRRGTRRFTLLRLICNLSTQQVRDDDFAVEGHLVRKEKGEPLRIRDHEPCVVCSDPNKGFSRKRSIAITVMQMQALRLQAAPQAIQKGHIASCMGAGICKAKYILWIG